MELLNFFLEEKRTVSIFAKPNSGSTTLFYNLIKTIFNHDKDLKVAFVSNDYSSKTHLSQYLFKNSISSKVDVFENFDDLKLPYNYIFCEDPDKSFNFLEASKKFPQTVFFYSKVTKKTEPNGNGQVFYSSGMMKLVLQSDLSVDLTKEDGNCFKLKIVKNRGFISIDSFYFSIDENRNINVSLEDGEPFFKINNKKFIKQEKPFLYFNYSSFDDYCSSLKVKKYVRDFLINKTITETESGCSVNYNYLNWFYLLKKTYKKFDPHLFVERMRIVDLKKGKSYLLPTDENQIVNTIKLIKQSSVYKQLSHYSLLADTVNMKSGIDKKYSILETNQFDSIEKLHDFLIDLDFLISFEHLNFENLFLFHLDSKEILIENKIYKAIVIKNAKQLVTIGRKMNLCIQSSWYVDLVKDNKCNILILSSADSYDFCLSFDPKLSLNEIKRKNNQNVSDEVKKIILNGLFDV
jgi:hypothetical protein